MTSPRETQGLGVKYNIPISLELKHSQLERHHSRRWWKVLIVYRLSGGFFPWSRFLVSCTHLSKCTFVTSQFLGQGSSSLAHILANAPLSLVDL
jgi:hypothetical protein